MSEEEKKEHVAFVVSINRAIEKYGLDGIFYWDTEEGLRYVLDYFERLERQEWGDDYNDLPYMFLCCWSMKNDLVDYGCTLRCCWLTEEGKEFLELLRKFFKKPCKLYWDDSARAANPKDEIMVAIENELFGKEEG